MMGIWRQKCNQCKKTKTIRSFVKEELTKHVHTTCKVCNAKNDVFREERNDTVREMWAKTADEERKERKLINTH